MQEGDRVVQVDDTPITLEMATDDVILLIRGDVGSQVTLSLERAGTADPIVVDITREIIETFLDAAEMLPIEQRVAAFDAEHAALLAERYPEDPLSIPHRAFAMIAKAP